MISTNMNLQWHFQCFEDGIVFGQRYQNNKKTIVLHDKKIDLLGNFKTYLKICKNKSFI